MSAPSYSVIQFLLNQMRIDEGDLAGGSVYFYSPGTTETTGIKVYLDKDGSAEANNPYTLDGDGTAQLYAAGSYRIVVKDANGVTQYDRDNIYFNAGSDYSDTVSVGDYASLSAAVTAIGATATRLLIDEAITVTADLVVPANIVLEQVEPGTITVNPGQTLTVTTAPIASSRQWFLGSGTVTVLGYPQDQAWWGNAQRIDASNFNIKAASVLASPYMIQNVSFTATVGSKALTIALKGIDGNNPSSTNPVNIAFRSATLTSANMVIRTVTSAKSVVVSSGSSLGFGAGANGVIYVYAIDVAGTVELAVCAMPKSEYTLQSTTAEGGAGGADSGTVLYSTTARSNIAVKLLGAIYIATGATAGEWDNAPTILGVMSNKVIRKDYSVQYADANGDPLDVALGAQYYVLMSNGTSSAPTFQAIGESTLASDAVSQAKLKTSTVSTTINCIGNGVGVTTLAGGEYGFEIQAKVNNTINTTAYLIGAVPLIYSGTDVAFGGALQALTTSYATYISYVYQNTGYTLSFQQRYVTSSGEVNWLFIRRDITTKVIREIWFSSDHPRFHSGGLKSVSDHPWMHMDLNALGQEVIVINPEQKLVESDLLDDEEADSWLDVFIKKYDIDEETKVSWPSESVTVGLPKVITDTEGEKRRVDDWRYEKMGMSIAPIKQVIPQPETVILKGFKVKAEVK